MQSLLFTGASGFLGSNILPLLKETYDVDTLALGDNATYNINLVKDEIHLNKQYDIVLHAAGKAHVVPKADAEIKLFYDINYEGTKKVCSALEESGAPKSFIFISTVAVYGCDFGEDINEEHPLNGDSPYAKSKIMAEEYLKDWCKNHNVILTILRPSLLAGKNAPGNLGAMVKGIKSGRYLSIAGGKARKSVLMVQDIANLLPLVANKGGIYNVCDDSQPTFRELEALISKQLGRKMPLSIPMWMAKSLAIVGNLLGSKAPINSLKLKKITQSLTFSNEKAKTALDWKPMNVLENFEI